MDKLVFGNCDYQNCNNDATTKGFVVLRTRDKDGKLQTADMYSCDKHKDKDGFFPYVEESANEK
jgi:hypothetical protein